MLEKETIKLALTVNFSLELHKDQTSTVLYQSRPLLQDYEINAVNTFTLQENGKIDSDDLTDFIQKTCLDFIYIETNIGKVLDKINYSINLTDVNYQSIN